MAKQYYSVLTTYGSQQLATAIASHQPLNITHFAVGDGNGQAVTPDVSRTSLVREVHRATISAVSRDPRNNKQVIFELTIPEDVGGFHIREMGIFDNQNKLIAYANCPESFKPTLSSGSGKIQVMRMILLVESSDAVTMKVDDSVIFVTRGQLTPKKITAESQNGVDNDGHSHEIEQASTTVKGIVQLTDELNLNNSKLALTAKAGKTLADRIAQVIAMLANYIPNSKKSDAINSSSSDNVATSKALKMVYDLANGKQDPSTTLAGYGITDFVLSELTTENLNNVQKIGMHAQTRTSNATIERNYPFSEAGSLIVTPSSYRFMQIYITKSAKMYTRNKTTDGWSEWKRIDGIDKAEREHAHNSVDISDFSQSVNNIIKENFTYQKIGDFEICKFPSGLMIQKYSIKSPTIRWNGVNEFSWAVSFSDIPSVYIQNKGSNYKAQMPFNIPVLEGSTASICKWASGADDDYRSSDMTFEFLAIGTWK
ncbi:phage tail protein [Bisgaard Taxon 45]